MADDHADEAPVFIVCAPRSGSTLLRALLNRHSDLHITRESHFLVGVGKRAFAQDADAALAHYFDSPQFCWLRLSKAAVLQRLDAWPSSRAASFIALMRADADRHGKRRVGDKTPAHALVLAEMLSMFPQARVVHIVRDPRAVVASLARMPWGAPSHLANALGCLMSVRAVLACDATAAGRLMHVRYEDMIATPEATLRAICAHIGVGWDARMLDADAPATTHAGALDAEVGSLPWLAQARRGVIRPRTNF